MVVRGGGGGGGGGAGAGYPEMQLSFCLVEFLETSTSRVHSKSGLSTTPCGRGLIFSLQKNITLNCLINKYPLKTSRLIHI